MRGPTRIGLLAISVVCAFAVMVTSALAAPRLWTDSTKTTPLRDVNATPKNQPDAAEFNNKGNVELVVTIAGLKKTIVCTEIEIGTTVVNNDGKANPKLALPFGVAEGDNCSVGGANVPTYFDTTPEGAVGVEVLKVPRVASVTITEPKAGEFEAALENLEFSQNVPGVGFCTGNLNGIAGKVENVTKGFVEEAPPNLNVQFTKAKVPIAGVAGCPTVGELTANFFLETPSTITDTAFVG